ncbi:hypothetical protein [Thaumasiovibrio subtropicus]|uniref:hypothetical protein n=1 Tax=Thaumasiovibrio subtropicus TaxID=1891207 RepID=UPI000B35335E|nr:hypothetical protein [Thaumasiovibrio subtropicus]
MPLVACPVCEKDVSKRAHNCPHCGEPDPARYHTRNAWLGRLFWLLVFAGGAYYVWQVIVPMVIDLFNR